MIKKIILLLFLIAPFLNIKSQTSEKELFQKYENFAGSTREIVYIHINKSVFLKDEVLGFSAYVFDKSKKEPISITKNLYCTLSNQKDEIIKSKLVKVEDGFANNIFKIDSTFSSGKYKFRAYTNWMLNFNERNFYEHPFLVINPDSKKEKNEITNNKKFKIQVTPEGGHLVARINNVVGIIVKDNQGFGLANKEGKIVDSKNRTIAEFTLNKFGIARTSITPIFNENYNVVLQNNNSEIIEPIKNIKNTGIVLSLSNLRDKLGITIKTNTETKEIIKDREYFLAIHNGHQLKSSTLNFKKDNEISKIVRYDELFSGINIFTVFDSKNNTPILERVFFNPVGISKVKINAIETTKEGDSTLVKMKLNASINLNDLQKISISVLPSTTDSYNFTSDILTKLYLEPYVKGFIQNASYYFSNNSDKTKYDLDNLLITQGWSSYDWKDIFKKQTFPHKFEQGINLVANINGESKEGFLAYPLKNNKTQIFKPNENDKAFIQTNLFPEDDEVYRVSLLKKKNRTEKPNLYIQFYPTNIPKLPLESYPIPFRNKTMEIGTTEFSYVNFNDAVMLDEVIIKSKEKENRKTKIRNKTMGSVEFFTDANSKGGRTLATYLSSRGFNATDYTGKLLITNPNPNSFNNNIPLVILDNVQLDDFSFLVNFSLNTVDYIEINKSGVGYGLRGGGGVIKIVTDPIKRMEQIHSKNETASFEFPLTFNSPKKYYTPIYKDYFSDIFKKYGVVSWLPNVKVDEKGFVSFKILNTNSNTVNLYVNGVVNNNAFISETKTIYPLEN